MAGRGLAILFGTALATPGGSRALLAVGQASRPSCPIVGQASRLSCRAEQDCLRGLFHVVDRIVQRQTCSTVSYARTVRGMRQVIGVVAAGAVDQASAMPVPADFSRSV